VQQLEDGARVDGIAWAHEDIGIEVLVAGRSSAVVGDAVRRLTEQSGTGCRPQQGGCGEEKWHFPLMTCGTRIR
jgi:hypothetical protein